LRHFGEEIAAAIRGKTAMRRSLAVASLACVAGAAQAQDSNFDLSVGLKAWNTQWTSWGYIVNAQDENVGISQVPLKDKLVLIPQLSARYKDFVGSISGFTPTTFEYLDGTTIRRKEWDVNVGWLFTPGVSASIGYKFSGQFAPESFEMAGPTISVSGTAPIRGPFSIYGTVGLGRLKTTSKSSVGFDRVDYQLSEVGFAYSLGIGNIPKAVSFTLGYRMQVLDTKEACCTNFGPQNARDLTQGFTLGVFGVF
jgi:hypothetical protein